MLRGVPAVFTIRSVFGVPRPDPIVNSDLARTIDPTGMRMTGRDGDEVLFKAVEGGARVAASADLLAGAERPWRLFRGERVPGAGAPGSDAAPMPNAGDVVPD